LKEELDTGMAGVTHPLLFECDRQGRVVWMSRRARAVLGDAPLPASIAECLRDGRSFRVWTALVMPETLLFAAQAEAPAAAASAVFGDQFIESYFRLENAERKLAAHMRRSRNGRGAPALRQIERERQRLGRELHTGVGQMLAAIRLQLEIIAAQMPDAAEPVRLALGRIEWLAQEALQQVRGISHGLYPPDWQRLTIEEALRQLWEVTGIPQRFEARLRIDPLAREPGQEVKVMLYRAAQEALSNIARHSGARCVEMTLETPGDRIVLSLRDDGRGFAAALKTSLGLGLRSIADACAEVGAKFEVESVPGSTTLRVWSPFEAT
jgi:signal transduction histidine kinase